jgi:hypothetical protein
MHPFPDLVLYVMSDQEYWNPFPDTKPFQVRCKGRPFALNQVDALSAHQPTDAITKDLGTMLGYRERVTGEKVQNKFVIKRNTLWIRDVLPIGDKLNRTDSVTFGVAFLVASVDKNYFMSFLKMF